MTSITQDKTSPAFSEFAKHRDSHKQASTLVRFLDLLKPLAVIKHVTVKHLMLGTFLVQVSAEVGTLPRQLDFFIPPSGDIVYRYNSTGNQVSIYLDRDKPQAIASASGGDWLALKMYQA